jgi:hypothetical protein
MVKSCHIAKDLVCRHHSSISLPAAALNLTIGLPIDLHPEEKHKVWFSSQRNIRLVWLGLLEISGSARCLIGQKKKEPSAGPKQSSSVFRNLRYDQYI